MTSFIAIDVETANSFMGSVCQIGLVRFDNGTETEAFNWLINPQTWFDDANSAIHGIDETTVANAPCFADIYPALALALAGAIVVHHTHFDRVSLNQACAHAGLAPIDCFWLDSAKVARRTWPDVAQRGYGLAPLAERVGIAFDHHDAEHDARAAGLVLMHALADSGLSLADWLTRSRQPIGVTGRKAIERDAIIDGPLSGETIVFTGQLLIPRRTAADLAQAWGAAVEDLVTQRTTLLVVGDQDVAKLAGQSKSSKHRKAEAMIAGGHPLRIIAEMDFLALNL